MITGDSIAAVGTVVALASALAGMLEVWHLVIAAVIGGIGTAIQMPAAQAAVPELVDHDQLDRANGFSQIGPAGGIVVAPVIATMLVSVGDHGGADRGHGHVPRRRGRNRADPFGSRLEHHPGVDDGDRCDGDIVARGWAPLFDWMRGSGLGVAALLALTATVNLCLGFFNVALVAVVATIDEQWAGLPLAVGGSPCSVPASSSVGGDSPIDGYRPSRSACSCWRPGAELWAAPVTDRRRTRCSRCAGRGANSQFGVDHDDARTVPSAMHGRMFALRGGIDRPLDPIGSVVAGVVISVLRSPPCHRAARWTDRPAGYSQRATAEVPPW